MTPNRAPRRATRRALLAAAALALAACAGGPVPPDWQANAHGSLEDFTAAYLAGNQRVADFEFTRGRAELARTGRADLVARAELSRCAAQVASLEFDDCPGFAALAAEATAAERAYGAFLAGQASDPALLPAHYRGVLAGRPEAAALSAIAAPLPRLIAAGVLLRTGRLPPAGIDLAIDTASAQGWRRPLLAWLGVQAQRAEAAGDTEAATRIRRRMELVDGSR